MRVHYCQTCKAQSPDIRCEACEWGAALLPENEDAFDLWSAVKTQWRASAAGLVGLVYGEVRAAARRLEITLSPCTERKIRALEADVLKMQTEARRQ